MIDHLYLPVVPCHTVLFLQLVLPHVAGVRHLRMGRALGSSNIRQELRETLATSTAERPIRLLVEAADPVPAGRALSLIEEVAQPVAPFLRIALLCPAGPVFWHETARQTQFRRFAVPELNAAWKWLIQPLGERRATRACPVASAAVTPLAARLESPVGPAQWVSHGP